MIMKKSTVKTICQMIFWATVGTLYLMLLAYYYPI